MARCGSYSAALDWSLANLVFSSRMVARTSLENWVSIGATAWAARAWIRFLRGAVTSFFDVRDAELSQRAALDKLAPVLPTHAHQLHGRCVDVELACVCLP